MDYLQVSPTIFLVFNLSYNEDTGKVNQIQTDQCYVSFPLCTVSGYLATVPAALGAKCFFLSRSFEWTWLTPWDKGKGSRAKSLREAEGSGNR